MTFVTFYLIYSPHIPECIYSFHFITDTAYCDNDVLCCSFLPFSFVLGVGIIGSVGLWFSLFEKVLPIISSHFFPVLILSHPLAPNTEVYISNGLGGNLPLRWPFSFDLGLHLCFLKLNIF